MKKSFFFSLISIFLTCCAEQSGDKNHSEMKFEEVFIVRPQTIALDSLSLDHYERGFSVFEDSTAFYYIAYNRKTHCIDWFDLTNGKIFYRTKLEKRGPNAVLDQVTGIYVHSIDTIFLNDGVFLYVIDKNGVIKQKKPNLFETESGMVSLVNSSTSALGYLPKRNSLIGEGIIPGKSELDGSVMFVEVSLSTGNLQIHNADISSCFTSKNNFNKHLNVHFKGDSIIYNAGCSYEIFVYDLATTKTKVFKTKSFLSKNKMSDITANDPEVLWKHFLENPKFFTTVYSTNDNRYYRLHWKETIYQINASTFSAAYEKPIILSVYNQNLELLYEMELPENQYLVDFLISSPQGIVLNANHFHNEKYEINTMELHHILHEN